MQRKLELEMAKNSVNAAVLAKTVPAATGTTEMNMAEMLKQIEVPKELRGNPQEAVKYQMEQLKKKVCSFFLK